MACVVSSTEDPLFGPVLSFGLAGVVPELLGDRGYGIPPLTDVEARDLIAAPGASPLLDGFGGTAPVDKAALEDLLLRLGMLSDDLPELASLSLEPVVVAPDGSRRPRRERRAAPARGPHRARRPPPRQPTARTRAAASVEPRPMRGNRGARMSYPRDLIPRDRARADLQEDPTSRRAPRPTPRSARC